MAITEWPFDEIDAERLRQEESERAKAILAENDLELSDYQPKVRHLAVLEISTQILVNLFYGGLRAYEVIENAIPEDARVAGVYHDLLRDTFSIILEHESFPKCFEMECPRPISPIIRMV